jgi:hypothetical protein
MPTIEGSKDVLFWEFYHDANSNFQKVKKKPIMKNRLKVERAI